MQDLNTTISRFNSINLDQMDEVKLMSRTDTKFAFKYTKLLTLLNRMRESYKVLEINDKRIHDYKSLYFDTAERNYLAIKEMKKIPEILECHYTTGNWSVLIKVLCKNNEHLMTLLNKQIQSINGVSRTETFISLEQQIDRQISIT